LKIRFQRALKGVITRKLLLIYWGSMFIRQEAAKLLAALKGCKDIEAYQKAKEKLAAFARRNPAALISHLTSENARVIGKAMRQSGAAGVAELQTIIDTKQKPQMYAALQALGEFESDAASEVESLTKLLSDDDAKLRQFAAHTLGRIGGQACTSGSELVRLAQYGDRDEKASAFFALGKIPYDDAIVAQVAADCLVDETEPQNVKIMALDALKNTECVTEPFLEEILHFLEQTTGRELVSSLWELINRVETWDEQMRMRAVRALEAFILKDPPHSAASTRILWKVDPGNALVLRRIEEGLNDDDSLESACDVICELGTEGARFVPLLLKKLEQHQDYWDFCWAAVDALNQIGPAAASARPMLEKMLNIRAASCKRQSSAPSRVSKAGRCPKARRINSSTICKNA